MEEAVEYVVDLYFPGIGIIRQASGLVFKKKMPELHFEIATQKVSFMLSDETDGGTIETDTRKVYTRRLLYKPVSAFFGCYTEEK